MSGRLTDYEFLSGALGGVGSPAARAAAGAAVRDWAAATLRAVADGSRPLRAVIHPLGFTCLPVERAGRDGVCVHVWPPRVAGAAPATPATPAIHAHSWELTSYVLAGALHNSLMTVAAAPPGPRAGAGGRLPLPAGPAPAVYRVLRVRSQGDVDELSPTRRLVHCRETRRERIAAGGTYGVPAGVFHATDVAPGAGAVTVALGRMVDGTADLSLAPPGAPGYQARRRRCDPAQTAAAARIVLGRLQLSLAR